CKVGLDQAEVEGQQTRRGTGGDQPGGPGPPGARSGRSDLHAGTPMHDHRSWIHPGGAVSTQPLVLVADDEPRITKLVSIALGEEGFRVVTAGGGEEALA